MSSLWRCGVGVIDGTSKCTAIATLPKSGSSEKFGVMSDISSHSHGMVILIPPKKNVITAFEICMTACQNANGSLPVYHTMKTIIRFIGPVVTKCWPDFLHASKYAFPGPELDWYGHCCVNKVGGSGGMLPQENFSN